MIFTGSRKWETQKPIFTALWQLQQRYGKDLLIIVGDAKGADLLVKVFCAGMGIEHEIHVADWEEHGMAAGPLRNQKMLQRGVDLVVGFPLGESKGTRHMMKIAEKAGVRVVDWPLEARKTPDPKPTTPTRLRRVRRPV